MKVTVAIITSILLLAGGQTTMNKPLEEPVMEEPMFEDEIVYDDIIDPKDIVEIPAISDEFILEIK